MEKLYKENVLKKLNSPIKTIAIQRYGQMDFPMQAIIFGL